MKKALRTFIHISTVFLFLIVGCKKEINKTSLLTINSADSNLVTPSVAIALAQHVANSHQANKIINSSPHTNVNLTGGSVYNGIATKQILDSLAIPNNVNPSYYIFNYVGGGFLVLSADKRTDPILAFSNSGYFKHSGNLPEGLVNWMSVNHKNMQLLRKNRTLKAPSSVKRRWAELLQNTGTQSTHSSGLVVNGLPPVQTCNPGDSTLAYIGPLLQTSWAQGPPYNGLCPTGSYWGSGNMPTGCVATAMAQVLYYYHHGSSYNWSAMPLTSSTTANSDVAQLMLDAGTSVNMVYNNWGSAPSSSSAITCAQAFKNSFGYTYATDGSYGLYNISDINTLENNLGNGWPVLLSGYMTSYTVTTHTFLWWTSTTTYYDDGHEWVCDGVIITESISCDVNGNPTVNDTYRLLHMNWGWADVGASNPNGWFNYNYWAVLNGSTVENFQYNLGMTYNIHP